MMKQMDVKCRGLLAYVWSKDHYYGDYSNYQKCMQLVKDYDRTKALVAIRQMLNCYRVQIDEWAYLCSGQYMLQDEAYQKAENIQIICDLHYIGTHIPAYALLREGKKEEAEALMGWIEECHNQRIHAKSRFSKEQDRIRSSW